MLQGAVDAIGDDEHSGLMLVRIQVGQSLLLSRLTKRAMVALQISAGQSVWVQVKAVALME